jgi:glycosyltransferase XagB
LHQRAFSNSCSPNSPDAKLKLALEYQPVLPLLSKARLLEALRRVPFREIAQVLQHRVVPVACLPGLILYASSGKRGRDYAKQHQLKLVATINPAEFHNCIRKAWGARLLHSATLRHDHNSPQLSAKHRVSTAQVLASMGSAVSIFAGFVFLPLSVMLTIASVLVALFFLSVVTLRLFCALPGVQRRQEPVPPLVNADLPIYSVLVPVFREVAVLDQMLAALMALNYPVDKLDIKIITEESDTSMRRALAGVDLPAYFEIIVVPSGKPQTKPRALNYALQFSRGELLTIYDAEDIPEPNQLRIAAARFHGADDRLACLQAQLVFFNPTENWLARQFTAEYATLFGLVLPALAEKGLPLPLGGTSNHFRVDILRKVGAWDPFNVTEDADLGLRLARLGYESGVIDSLTYEEANLKFTSWTLQRARWLKGFLQTWLVHMRNPAKTMRELGVGGFWVLQSCTLGVFISALLHPILAILSAYLFITSPSPAADAPLYHTMQGGLNLAIFVSGYGVTMFAANRALLKLGLKNWWFTIATMPAYWFLMAIAAWMALWQFIVAPFVWNKTEHGLSKLQSG